MKRRKALVLSMVALLFGAAALALFLWFRSSERSLALLRLLPPQADLYGMADFAALQTNPGVRQFLSDPPALSVEEDYKRFVEATGFRYQDDLRQLALAKLGSNWVGAARVRWDQPRIIRYLESREAAKSQEQGQTVFSVGQVRPFRLVLLERDLAVFTIGEDATLIQQALQKYSGATSDSGATELDLSQEWKRLPLGSALWLVGRMDRLLNQDEWQPQVGPFSIGNQLLRGSKTLTVSVQSRLTRLEFEVQDRCQDAAAAERIARTVQSLLALLRALPPNESNPMQSKLPVLIKDISVEQVENSVQLQWQWDAETLRRLK